MTFSPGSHSNFVSGTIIITSPHENVIATCRKVASSQQMHGGQNAPQYSLFGVGTGGSAFWGEPSTFLGWYTDLASITKEVGEIQQAISQGLPTYTLKYSARVKRKGLRITMI